MHYCERHRWKAQFIHSVLYFPEPSCDVDCTQFCKLTASHTNIPNLLVQYTAKSINHVPHLEPFTSPLQA